MGKNQWVSPRGNGKWGVHGEGNERDTKQFENKKDAIDYGKAIAKNQGSELIIQGGNGRIQSKDSYGKDPNPPKDTEH
ncbi:DUF2188 domain-containing protein [Desulfosporosinus youngiae]|uniref:DUF2188 domain-containing protein n=1 Tax=Desulfosporosinus youngiae DSM 17734 TaxID=768710 RepID=H5Y2L4_9FIRM|nr:DUF2188 domain-containing protein [Desulfosporosinus youngiae]EHQ88277.1 hypothetical protein DesyoDRAFT_1107 [Desulfosporosinus youngiae DSM 17734]